LQLLKLRALGVTLCNFLSVSEVLYFVGIGLLWFTLPDAGGVAAASGVGNMGVSPQII
jgi:hypothetical protein